MDKSIFRAFLFLFFLFAGHAAYAAPAPESSAEPPLAERLTQVEANINQIRSDLDDQLKTQDDILDEIDVIRIRKHRKGRVNQP